jgi:hypothetical protein
VPRAGDTTSAMIRDDLNPLDQPTPDYEPLYPPFVEPQRSRGPVLDSALRYWYLILLPMLLFAAAAVAYSQQRDPTYKAEARLNVGGFNISAQSLPGFAGGAYLLANTYSRAAYGDAVLGPVGRQVGMTPAQLADVISASPVKDSPVIRLEAETKNGAQAVAIVNLTAENLQRHARTLAGANPDTQRLFTRFKAASRDYAKALARSRRAHKRHKGVAQADTAVELARLRKDSVAGLYSTSLGGQATTSAVQILSPARGATNDRRSVMERLLAAGLLGGFAIGVALAYLVGRSRMPGRIAH